MVDTNVTDGAVTELSDEEAALAFADDEEGNGIGRQIEAKISGGTSEDIPDWVVLPQGFQIPPGKCVSFLNFKAEWTDAPWKGDRVLVCWTLSEREEQLAYTRGQGNATKSVAELAKMTIRCIDGTKVDWSGKSGPGNVAKLWDELGGKCRQMVQNTYLKTHTLTAEDLNDFFTNRFAVRRAVAVVTG